MSYKLDLLNNENYKLIKTTVIEEHEMVIYELSHNKTKAKIVLMDKDDENRVFNIAFRTPVSNSKGIPHILEHSVLCGSKKYNVKDPFVELAKSSMNTFLNAMTYPDKTCYPVASANLKDYKNLTDVYLDAVFFPNIYKNKYIFMQEGWHYEVENGNMTVNGVVLNEMRGVYSDKEEILSDLVFKTLYKDTNYAHAYGGDPKEIINLSYEEFLDFHKKYYSPSNCIIFFYGKLDFNERLAYLHNEYLSKFDYDEKNVVDFKKYFDINNCTVSENNQLVHENGFYNIDVLPENKDLTALSYNFIIDKTKNTIDYILFRILNYILFSQEGAIIKDELIKNNLGQSIKTLFEPGLYKTLFSIIALNIDESKKDVFIKCLDDKIKFILENGFEKDKFEAGINAVYYDYLEKNDSQEKGLDLILSCLDSYLYNEDISIYIEYKKSFDIIRKMNVDDLSCPIYTLLRDVFIYNKYKNIVSISPKVNLLNEYNAELISIIDNRKNNMTDSQYKKTIDESNGLKKYQEIKDEDYSCLPKLLISDIDRDKKIIDYNLLNIKNEEIVTTIRSIDDLVYVSLNIKLDNFTDFEIFLLSLMLSLLSKIDVTDCDYQKLNNLIDIYIGHFDKNIISYEDDVYIRLRINTVINYLDDALDILYKILFTTIFDDKKRILEILKEINSQSSSDIISSGHKVALCRSYARVSNTSRIIDMTSSTGIAFKLFLNDFIKCYEDNWSYIINDFKFIYKKLFNKDNFLFDACLDNKNIDKFKNSLNRFLDRLENTLDASLYKFTDFMDVSKYLRTSNSEAFLINSDVNFVARAGKFKKESFNGSMFVLSNLFNYDYLWNNIRVLGGAYGCASKFNKEGIAGFATYRDPNLIKSDECFKNSINYLESLNTDSVDVDKLIISTIANFDNPLNAYNAHESNVAYHFCHKDNNYLNSIRHQVLDTTIDTLKDIDNQLVDIINTNETCALVAEKSIEEAKQYYKTITKLDLT